MSADDLSRERSRVLRRLPAVGWRGQEAQSVAMQQAKRWLDRRVTLGAQKLLLGMAVLTALGLLCWFPLSGYLDSINWWAPPVDLAKLQERARREQPVGGTEPETVAFLRSLGFEDRHIRIAHYAPAHPFAGRLARIEGWIPQRYTIGGLSQVRAYCQFTDAGRLQECSILRGGSPESDASGNVVETTPVLVR